MNLLVMNHSGPFSRHAFMTKLAGVTNIGVFGNHVTFNCGFQIGGETTDFAHRFFGPGDTDHQGQNCNKKKCPPLL